MDNYVKVCFSINEYDSDGDIIDKGIFLHFGNTKIKVTNDLDGLKNFKNHIEKIIKEIEENYFI
jgi:hypothetical protein